METDKHYFFEGLFIIVLASAAVAFFLWLANFYHRDDIHYRIHFNESVSGLALGDPVKFNGVDVGTVKELSIDRNDPRKVQVDVRLSKAAPVKTDTRATLKLKGFAGTEYIELTGGSASAQDLVAATPAGEVPEIASEKSTLAALLEQLPVIVRKFSGIEDKVQKVATDAGALTGKLRERFAPADKDKQKPDAPTR
jgi:phospholipid/cholesterol/gamma-HCH transport system substrate-binding protein